MSDDPLHWARGRRIAIRPDGARRSFDPVATCLLRTSEERVHAARVLHELYEQARTNPWTAATRLFREAP